MTDMGNEAPEDSARMIDRRTTVDGSKSHAEQVTLRSTSQSSIDVHTVFLDNGEISVKLRGWHKTGPGGMRRGWPTGEMTLSHREAEQLKNLLSQYLTVGEHPDHGEYLVVRLDEAEALGGMEGAVLVRGFAQVLRRPELVQHLTADDFSDELLAAVEGHVRLRELRMAVETLKGHLATGDDDEAIYQAWCDAHPWVFGSA